MLKLRDSRVRWGRTVFVIVLVDQVTKYWAENSLALHDKFQVTRWLDFSLWHNTGAAFSFLSGASGWQNGFFILITCLISIAVFVWLARLRAKQVWVGYSLALILGGALGNLIDRIVHGYVIDFIHLHYKHWSFPVFNVADTAITFGAIFLIIETFLISKPLGTDYDKED